jgi:hypothetical protein
VSLEIRLRRKEERRAERLEGEEVRKGKAEANEG